ITDQITLHQHRLQIIHACLQTLPCFRSPSGSGLMDGVRYVGVFIKVGGFIQVLLQSDKRRLVHNNQ
ncbi:MAG: hypothetical protein AB7D24_11840, partial [Sphaerochaeta sp.]|uniref:hypothetical protein n=1 Tax=Sphaerochaeta sp. TaxID=1972642 RepID=UPI003D0E4ABD